MKKYIDRKILETLIAKYGAKGVNNAINRLNENNENLKSGIFIEYHDHISCDAFRILVLDNGVNVLKNDPLEVEAVSSYTGKRYITKLEPKYNNDYIEVDFVRSYSGDLCLVKAVKELHAKYSNLPIYCFTEGFYTFRGEYKNVQELFNDIFSEYLRGLSFEFIPGTMGEFLKSDVNESLNENFGQAINGAQNTTIEDYEHYWNVNIEINYFNKNNNQCVIYMWLPEDETINEIPEALLEDGIIFERNGMNYWFEPNPSDCYLTYNGTCISLGGYAYPEY